MEGLNLLPGDDGNLPVRIRWAVKTDIPEAMAVDGDVIYVADVGLTAFRISDGSVVWQGGTPDVLEASGGVQIGLDGPNVVWVFAPFEFNLRVDRRTGEFVKFDFDAGGDAPPQFSPLAAPPPPAFRVQVDLTDAVGYRPDGGIAWRLVTDNPFVNAQPAVDAKGAIAFVTSNQYLVLLDVQ